MLRKQRIDAGLWMNEIEKDVEAKLGDSIVNGGDDIKKLLDSCSEYVFPSISLFVLDVIVIICSEFFSTL